MARIPRQPGRALAKVSRPRVLHQLFQMATFQSFLTKKFSTPLPHENSPAPDEGPPEACVDISQSPWQMDVSLTNGIYSGIGLFR
ncbi:hypothetical protein EVAR_79300_1 [Eumeta japonica]|uniref:Uncharacterized protein n=1 Tax=Eumeta variegata TaxID=151549 RepID=A0A4C1THN5_EUMVA|nr:hypothetical protein EVAR_79300_1 [Eumeta japonica]